MAKAGIINCDLSKLRLGTPFYTDETLQMNQKFYYTYILEPEKIPNRFYTGFTKDLKLRIEQHNKGQVESTKERRPFKLIYYEACLDRRDATHCERYLKTYHGKTYIKKRLKSYLTGSR